MHRTEGFWWDLLEAAYTEVLRYGDFMLGDAAQHVVEVSPFVMRELERDDRWGLRVGGPFRGHADGTVRLMGMFRPVAVWPGSSRDIYTEAGVEAVPIDFLHLAVRVERANGRFRYWDWTGNREDLT